MSNFFEELKRRNVYKVAVAYLVTAWLIIQVVSTVGPNLNWPDSIAPLVTRIILVGFPIALVLAWLYEFTPKGLKRTGAVQLDTTDNRSAGRRLNRVIIGTLALTLCLMLVERVFFAGRTSINERQQASIAVLPFENLSQDAEYAFFANALPARIIDELAIISGLSVTNRTSSFGAKENIQSIKEIAELLNVNYLLDGELQYDTRSNRIRISAQLINAANGYIMWSQTFEDNFDQIQDMQEKVCRAVSSKLRVHLLPEEDKALSEQITENDEAYKLFLKAKEFSEKRTEKDLLKAINLLNQALELAPEFAEAHAHLTRCYGLRGSYGNINKEERTRLMKLHLDKAVALAPENPEVLFTKASYNMRILGDTTNVVSDLKKVIEKKPGFAEAHYELSNALSSAGQPDLAYESLKKVLQLDPGNSFYNAMLAKHLFWRFNEHEKAIAIIDRQLLISPDAPNANRLALFKSLFVVEAYGDLVESFKLKYWEYKKDPTERWNLNYGTLGALGLDLWPWSEKLARTIQLRYSDSWAVYNNLSKIYLFKRDMEAYKDLVNYAIQEQWLIEDEATLAKAHIQLMLGNIKDALNIFEQEFPNFVNEEILTQELSESIDINFIVYTDLLRLHGQDQKANRFSDKLCAYYKNKIATDPEVNNHKKNKMELECFYASDQKINFLEVLEEIYFVKKDRRDWFTNMKMGDYLRFENDPEYQKLFRKIEAEVHRQRAEVIAYLKEEGDWDPAWDKELGLE